MSLLLVFEKQIVDKKNMNTYLYLSFICLLSIIVIAVEKNKESIEGSVYVTIPSTLQM